MKKTLSDPQPDDMLGEYDFSEGKPGVYYEWYQRAKGRFRPVTDEEDRARQAKAEPRRISGRSD